MLGLSVFKSMMARFCCRNILPGASLPLNLYPLKLSPCLRRSLPKLSNEQWSRIVKKRGSNVFYEYNPGNSFIHMSLYACSIGFVGVVCGYTFTVGTYLASI